MEIELIGIGLVYAAVLVGLSYGIVFFRNTPLSNQHLLSFTVFFLLSIYAIYKIWKLGKKQPPLLLVIYLSFLIIGIVLNFTLALQLLSRTDGELYINSSGGIWMMFAPIFSCCNFNIPSIKCNN